MQTDVLDALYERFQELVMLDDDRIGERAARFLLMDVLDSVEQQRLKERLLPSMVSWEDVVQVLNEMRGVPQQDVELWNLIKEQDQKIEPQTESTEEWQAVDEPTAAPIPLVNPSNEVLDLERVTFETPPRETMVEQQQTKTQLKSTTPPSCMTQFKLLVKCGP